MDELDKPLEKEYVRKEKAKDDTSSYRDFSQLAINNKKEQNSKPSFLSLPLNLMNFPQKLYIMLSNPKFEGVITWLPHGRAWKILKPNLFKQFVVPQYFIGKYATFIRQVNGWGFRKITHNSYYHEMFLRGIPHLCDQMKRLTKTDMEIRKKEGNQAQPNFHKFCNMHPVAILPNSDNESSKGISDFNTCPGEGTFRTKNIEIKSSLCQLHDQSDCMIIQEEKSEIEKWEEISNICQRRLEAVKRKRLLLTKKECIALVALNDLILSDSG